MKAKYGPTPTTIDHVVASLIPDTDTQPTICSPDCKCVAHIGLAIRPARGNEGRQLSGNVVAALAVRTDETPHPLTESEDNLHPVCAKPSGIIVAIDEINNEKVDTFGAFFSNNKDLHRVEDDTQAFLKQFVFAGSENQVHRLKDLVMEYRDIFSDVLAERATDLTLFRFNVEEPLWETPGNRTPCRPQSVKNNIEIEKAITMMLADGVIEKLNASYYSHPVIVQKTEDKVRVCIHYRNLNACIKPASWPLPNIRGLFERIGHNKPTVFGVMDLTAGYHQDPPYLPHRVFTAFLCFCGLYQFTRLPFGPKRAPSYFQEQMVTKVLQGLLYVSCEMYLDKCIVYASSEDQFLVRLKEVFQRFRERGLLLKAKKCKFGLPQIEYVDRVISNRTVLYI